MALKALLTREKFQQQSHGQVLRQNPIWREVVTHWYFHVIDSLCEFERAHGSNNNGNDNDGNQRNGQNEVHPDVHGVGQNEGARRNVNNVNYPSLFFRPAHRSMAHTAMKILDVYLSSCPLEFQDRARRDQRCFKLLALASLFVVLARPEEVVVEGQTQEPQEPQDPPSAQTAAAGMTRVAAVDDMKDFLKKSSESEGADSVAVDQVDQGTPISQDLPILYFLQMCHAHQEISKEEFSSFCDSIRSFLLNFSRNHDNDGEHGSHERLLDGGMHSMHPRPPNTMPLTSNQFHQEFKNFLLEHYRPQNHFPQCFRQIEALLDETLSNVNHANYFANLSPSVVTLAAYLVVFQTSASHRNTRNPRDHGSNDRSARSDRSGSAADRKQMLHLLTYYKVCGGEELSSLKEVVDTLRVMGGFFGNRVGAMRAGLGQMDERRPQGPQNPRRDESFVHVVPDCDG